MAYNDPYDSNPYGNQEDDPNNPQNPYASPFPVQSPPTNNKPNTGYDRGAVMDRWQKLAGSGQHVDSLQGWLDQNQDVASGVQATNNGEYMQLPGEKAFDVMGSYNKGSGGGAWWGSEVDWAKQYLGLNDEEARKYESDPQAYARLHPEFAAKIAGPAAPLTGPSGVQGPFSQPGLQPAPGSQYQDLLDQLVARSKQSLAVNRNDPTIRAQADPYSANVERSSRNYLADMAEKAGPNANLQGEARMAAERSGQASGLFESQLIGRELDSRRTEIQNALSQMGSMLTSQQQMALQKELALINDSTQRLGIQSQQDQFDKNLGFQVDDRSSYWDALRSGLLK